MNDSSALAAAVVGVAMGSGGCGMAVAAAGVVILSDNLLLVRPTLRIAILARQVILQNCVFAVAVKVMAIVLAILGRLCRPYSLGRSFTLLYVCMYVCFSRAGRLQLWEAVVVDIGSLVVVVFNGLRPLRFAFTAD